MKLVSALVGLAALGGVALSSAAASATPIDIPAASTVVPAGYVCNEWGHCWHRHWGGGYPHRWGGYGWHRHWGGGYGWHHWHHPWAYGGGYGWRPHWGGGWGWHHWHHWSNW
jgi:hypothetical protein